MRKITLMAALMAASCLVAVPAAAQNDTTQPQAEQTAELRLAQITRAIAELNLAHLRAAQRCDRVEMARLAAEAVRLANEGRRIINVSRAAGAYSTVTPETLQHTETSLNSDIPQINARRPENCPPVTAPQPQLAVPTPAPSPATSPQPAPVQLQQAVPAPSPVPPPPVQPTPVQPQTAQERAAQEAISARDTVRVAAQQRLLDDVNQILLNGEDARRAGRCDEHDALVAAAGIGIRRLQDLLPEGDVEVEALRARRNALGDAPCPPPTPATAPTNQISAGVSYFNRQAPVTGAGVRILPGNERFATVLSDRVNGYVADVSATFGLNSTTDSGLTFGGRIARSDDRAAAQFAPGSGPVGSVYHDRAPNGSTGINLGATGLDAVIGREARDFAIDVGYSRRLNARTSDGLAFGGRIRLQYESQDTDLDLSLRSPTFPTITMDALQEVRQNNLGVSAGLNLDSTWDNSGAGDSKPRGGFVWSGQVDVTAYRADSKLRSMQRNVCGVCGVAERDFTINISDDDKRWGFGAEAGLELGYRFPSGFEIGVNGAVGYRSQVAGVHNPETGDDLFIRNQPTQLRFSDSYRYQAGIYSRLRF